MPVEHGAKINATNTHNNTVLQVAAYKNNLKKAKFLLDIGADLNISPVNGFTPLHLTAQEGHPFI